MNTFYFGGVYSGTNGTEKFWNKVGEFIHKTYNEEELKRIFISGDGASWIKSGAKYLNKALFCADKFHMVENIVLLTFRSATVQIVVLTLSVSSLSMNLFSSTAMLLQEEDGDSMQRIVEFTYFLLVRKQIQDLMYTEELPMRSPRISTLSILILRSIS